MKNLFDNGSTSTSVKKLSAYVKPKPSGLSKDQDDCWSEKAVKSLVKKLKKSKLIEELEKALATQDPLTHCVYIPRSVDGRLQVSQRKCLPHVVYCRIWRYPEIVSPHQLRSVPHCIYPFSKKLDNVCVNPFHYEKIETPEVPPIVIKTKEEGTLQSSNLLMNNRFQLLNKKPSEWLKKIMTGYEREDGQVPNCELPLDSDDSAHYCETSVLSESAASAPPTPSLEDTSSSLNPRTEHMLSKQFSEKGESDVAVMEAALLDYAVEKSLTLEDNQKNPKLVAVEYREPPFWCTVAYYEHSQRVGDLFFGSGLQVCIDGFTNPSTDSGRFCLGLLSNSNRTVDVVEARRQIGRGCRFYTCGNEIYLECLSDQAIFVQNANCNRRHGLHLATVCKIPSRCALCVFKKDEFAYLVEKCVPFGFEAVYALTRLCSVRFSFIKGWGSKYKRQRITDTPCWIDAYFNGPLQWLDSVLKQMGTPPYKCSSFT